MPSGIKIPKELQKKIWRAINIDKMFYSQVVKKLGVSRKTARKYSKEDSKCPKQ